MILCHYCEAELSLGQLKHDCPFISLAELRNRVADAAVYALVGSGSITAECRRDAAVLVFVWARSQSEDKFDRDKIDAMTEEAYQYFEFGGEDYPPDRRAPKPEWAIWGEASPSEEDTVNNAQRE